MADLKKILVAVTGMSPQIVTETLYALHTQHQWLPEEIHVLTTQTGAENIIGSLLGENGFFRRLCAEYALPAIRFDTDCIHVIQGKQVSRWRISVRRGKQSGGRSDCTFYL